MKKKILLIVLLVFAASTLLMAAAPAKAVPVRLTIINKTDEKVMVSLTSSKYGLFYFLTVNPFKTKTFTVTRAVYGAKYFSCGTSRSGYLDATTQVRLVFTSCYSLAVNRGEPTQEKIHINGSYYTDTPPHLLSWASVWRVWLPW